MAKRTDPKWDTLKTDFNREHSRVTDREAYRKTWERIFGKRRRKRKKRR